MKETRKIIGNGKYTAEDICRMYKDGISQNKLARVVNTSFKIIVEVLKSNNVRVRSRGELYFRPPAEEDYKRYLTDEDIDFDEEIKTAHYK